MFFILLILQIPVHSFFFIPSKLTGIGRIGRIVQRLKPIDDCFKDLMDFVVRVRFYPAHPANPCK
jgi:hypothetical protein